MTCFQGHDLHWLVPGVLLTLSNFSDLRPAWSADNGVGLEWDILDDDCLVQCELYSVTG